MSSRQLLILCGTRHRPAAALRLVESVVAHTEGIDWRLAIADASDPGRPAFRCDENRVRVLWERPRRWMSGGLNDLVARAQNDYGWLSLGSSDLDPLWHPEFVAWLNDDATVEPGWAAAAIDGLEDYEQRGRRVGMVALPYLTPHPPAGWHVNYWPDPALPYANFGLLPRQLWEELGGFDERVPFRGCDNAFACRVLEAGYAIAPVAGARVVHHYAEDATRTQNATDESSSAMRGGWDTIRRWAVGRLADWRELQAREVGIPPGFTLRGNAWVETKDADATYLARYGQAAGNPTADAAVASPTT